MFKICYKGFVYLRFVSFHFSFFFALLCSYRNTFYFLLKSFRFTVNNSQLCFLAFHSFSFTTFHYYCVFLLISFYIPSLCSGLPVLFFFLLLTLNLNLGIRNFRFFTSRILLKFPINCELKSWRWLTDVLN